MSREVVLFEVTLINPLNLEQVSILRAQGCLVNSNSNNVTCTSVTLGDQETLKNLVGAGIKTIEFSKPDFYPDEYKILKALANTAEKAIVYQ
jgi:hypothetical protein